MKIISIIFSLFFLASCVAYRPIIKPDYEGPTAVVIDTFERKGRGSGNFYYVKQYNDNPIVNTVSATHAASQGQGANFSLQGASRKVPITQAKLKLVGQVHHNAPVSYLFNANSNYLVSGDITFTPEPEQIYLVKGYLSDTYSAVWIEDTVGNIASEILENYNAEDPAAINKKKDVFAKKEKYDTSSKIAVFSNISGGETVKLVEMKLGKPDRITEIEANFLLSRPSNTLYHYEQLGTVKFIRSNTLYVESVLPSAVSTQIDENQLNFQVENYNPEMLQVLAKSMFIEGVNDVESLDVVAARIWQGRATTNKHEIDALSWFCKALGKSKNARYRNLLSAIAETAASDKLKRYARSNLELLPEETKNQFQFQ